MAKPTYFSYTSYAFVPDEKRISFKYEIGFADREALSFTEEVLLPEIPELSHIPPELIGQLLRDIHLMLGISYYKLYCPPEIRTPYELSQDQARFWETVYRKGLGEFAYRNNLDLRGIQFPSRDGEIPHAHTLVRSQRALVGIGGGKDSIVALELLKETGYERDGFVIETYTGHDVADSVCEIAGIGSIKIRRMLDKQVFERLPESFSGHIPISAVYAFLGTLAALLYDYQCVVTGNEYSSNFGNVEHHGEIVNHQWSKSAEFENMFNEYLRTYVTDSITYFSIVRPFYEIRIAQLLSNYPQYFSRFTSCNRKFRIDSEARPRGMWCCECPKCAFVFLILAPSIAREELIAMFGRNLLDDQALVPLYKDILGFGTMKPFDCVGTFDEAQAAVFLAGTAYADSAVVKTFLPQIQNGEELAKKVMRAEQALSVPTRFRFCGMKSALILGYGKEGKSTEVFLIKTYPQLEIGIADEATDTRYLDIQDAYDVAVKTPGIRKEKVRIQYTTATNIFFSRFPGTVIGVTGSKGKSTTASLLYAILHEAGLPVFLAGNIGLPMLELLEKDVDEKSIAVVELSSYQLDDIEFSPHIAAVTNLFPEHMDYHGDAETYYAAKKNILRFQNENDTFIYNADVVPLKEWAGRVRGKTLPFAELPFDKNVISLLGEHNVVNVRAAVTVAQQFAIDPNIVERAVQNFKGLPHRLELVGEFNGIRFYDDAISTTPESTIAALHAVKNIGTIFLGGFDRGYDFAELEKEIRTAGIKNIVLFPETGKRMFAERSDLNILETSDMREAVAFAYKNSPIGSAALLSCASPSYGVWKNFEEKGDEFKAAVTRLASAA